MNEKTFAEKYGLVGKGIPVRISESTKRYAARLYRESAELLKKGEEYVKNETRRFGGQQNGGGSLL